MKSEKLQSACQTGPWLLDGKVTCLFVISLKCIWRNAEVRSKWFQQILPASPLISSLHVSGQRDNRISLQEVPLVQNRWTFPLLHLTPASWNTNCPFFSGLTQKTDSQELLRLTRLGPPRQNDLLFGSGWGEQTFKWTFTESFLFFCLLLNWLCLRSSQLSSVRWDGNQPSQMN